MKQKYYILIFAILFTNVFSAKKAICKPLGEKAFISLITCGPGDELYSVFGHSAFRVFDPEQNIDVTYNYGTFNFDEPGFYTKFVRGKLNYMIDEAPFEHFYSVYMFYDRSIYEQVLNLDSTEKNNIYEFLKWNAKPENKYYLYEFFYDNCSSRLRDIVAKEKGGFSTSDSVFQEITFRETLDQYVKGMPWTQFGFYVTLGLPADKIASDYNAMFIPDKMQRFFRVAKANNEKIILQERTLYSATQERLIKATNWPLITFTILAFIAILFSYLGHLKKLKFKWFDVLLSTSVLLVFILLTFLWFFTDHRPTVDNLNLLWATPFPFMALFIKSENTIKWIAIYYFSLTLIIAVFFPVFPQKMHIAIVPILVAITSRLYSHWKTISYES